MLEGRHRGTKFDQIVILVKMRYGLILTLEDLL